MIEYTKIPPLIGKLFPHTGLSLVPLRTCAEITFCLLCLLECHFHLLSPMPVFCGSDLSSVYLRILPSCFEEV